jgi:hypothetical protein
LSAALITGFATGFASPAGALSPVERIEAVVQEMQARFAPLDAACDFRASFAITYLLTTRSVLDALRADAFEDPEWMGHLDQTFADLYFQAFDRYVDGEAVPEPWRYAFERAAQQVDNVLQDALLGINAHINYDLALAVYTEGLSTKGRSHLADYNRINQTLQSTAVPLIEELARLYDPFLYLLRPFGREVSEVVAELFRIWRDEAWQNAVRLEAAASDEAFEAVRADMEARALARAQEIASPDFRQDPGGRLFYCHLRQ